MIRPAYGIRCGISPDEDLMCQNKRVEEISSNNSPLVMSLSSTLFSPSTVGTSPAVLLGCVLTACLLIVACDDKGAKPTSKNPSDPNSISTMVVAKTLREIRSADANYKLELASLERQMNHMERDLLAGFKQAADGQQPMLDMEHMVEELKIISKLLKGPELCAFAKSLEVLRLQLNRKQTEFDEKCKNAATGKSEYLAMIKEIVSMKDRLATLTNRLIMLQADSERLIDKTSEWVTIYRDAVETFGEPEARNKLRKLLSDDPMTAKQFETPKPAAPNSTNNRQGPKSVALPASAPRPIENLPAALPAAVPKTPPPQANKPGRPAIINDSDGWSNLRLTPSPNAKIIRRILLNEVFYVNLTQGEWCHVVTAKGENGWMHSSVVKYTK